VVGGGGDETQDVNKKKIIQGARRGCEICTNKELDRGVFSERQNRGKVDPTCLRNYGTGDRGGERVKIYGAGANKRWGVPRLEFRETSR